MAFVFFIESAGFSWLLEEEGGGLDRACRVGSAGCLGDCTCQCRMVLGRDLMRCTMQVFEAATCISRPSSVSTFLHNYYSLNAFPPTLPEPSNGESPTESESAILVTPHHRCCSAALSAACSAFFVFLVCRVRACSSSVSSGHQTTSFKPGMHLMPSAQLQSSRPSW
jgi:hypothetical protein